MCERKRKHQHLNWFTRPITTIFFLLPFPTYLLKSLLPRWPNFILTNPRKFLCSHFPKLWIGAAFHEAKVTLLLYCLLLHTSGFLPTWLATDSLFFLVASSSLQPFNVSETRGSNPWAYTLATSSPYFDDFIQFQDFNNKYKLISPKLIASTLIFSLSSTIINPLDNSWFKILNSLCLKWSSYFLIPNPRPWALLQFFSMLVKRIIIHQVLESDPWKPSLIPTILSSQIQALYLIVLLQNMYFPICIPVYSVPHPSRKLLPLTFTAMTTGPSETIIYVCHPHHLALHIEQSEWIRSIHTTKPFFCFKALILLIAPREMQRLHPGQQGSAELIPAYLPDLSYCILTLSLCSATMTSFVFPNHAKTVAATQSLYLFPFSLEFCTSFQALCLAGSFPSFKAQFH